MKIGIGPTFQTPTQSWSAIKRMAEIADEGPYSSFAVLDRLAYDSYEPLATLAAVASVTSRVRLTTAVLVSPLRTAGILAKQAATVDAISEGRLTLGLAVGSRADDSLVAPSDHHTRGRRFTEQLVEMKQIWAGEKLEGATFAVGPMPVQHGGPELLLGGTAEAAIDRVGRFGDGYVMGGRGNEESWVRATIAKVSEAWAKHGRSGKPRFVASLPCAFGPDAQQQIDEAVGHYYGGRSSRTGDRPAGLPATSREAVRELIAMQEAAGVDELILRPVRLDLAQVDLLTESIS